MKSIPQKQLVFPMDFKNTMNTISSKGLTSYHALAEQFART
jgi:hypothetical protein